MGSKSLKLGEINTMPALIGIPRNNFALITVCLLSFGCSGCQSGWGMNDYRSAVRSGRSLIAPALEMEKQFPKTEHMLIMYGGTGSAKHEWQTVSFFGGRYELTMSTDVVLSSDGTRIISASESPTFVLWVCESIKADGNGASFHSSRERKFGLETWNKFKESGFDVAILDPFYDGSVLPYFEEYANGWQESRRVWR
jgi:hypothetical protein